MTTLLQVFYTVYQWKNFEFRKSVNIWWTYDKLSGLLFSTHGVVSLCKWLHSSQKRVTGIAHSPTSQILGGSETTGPIAVYAYAWDTLRLHRTNITKLFRLAWYVSWLAKDVMHTEIIRRYQSSNCTVRIYGSRQVCCSGCCRRLWLTSQLHAINLIQVRDYRPMWSPAAVLNAYHFHDTHQTDFDTDTVN